MLELFYFQLLLQFIYSSCIFGFLFVCYPAVNTCLTTNLHGTALTSLLTHHNNTTHHITAKQTCAPACGTSTSVITACVSTRDACVTIVSTAMIDLMSLAAMVVSVD